MDTSFLFPDHDDKKIPMGEEVTVLCHFENNAKLPLNITSIMGSLNNHRDFSDYVQNYTQKFLGVLVKPGIIYFPCFYMRICVWCIQIHFYFVIVY